MYKTILIAIIYLPVGCFLVASCQCNRVDYVPDLANHSENAKLLQGSITPICSIDSDWELKPFEQMRIKIFFGNLSKFSNQDQNEIKDCFNKTAQDLGKIFLVRRSSVRLGLPATGRCNHSQAFSHHVRDSAKLCDQDATDGIADADFVVYVGQIECQGNQLASAFCCAYSFDGRPTFGFVDLCPRGIETDNWNRRALEDIFQHELLHAMGLSGDFFSKTFQDKGSLLKGQQTFIRIWQVNKLHQKAHNAALVVTPKVKSFVRYHFNCSDLEGAEIENEGGNGTAGDHWEKRIFGPEIMTGFSSRRTYLSYLTLAYLEDSGFYQTNYSLAVELPFGKDLGCVFAKQSCREYMDTKKDAPGVAKPYCNWADYVEQEKSKSTFRDCNEDLTAYTFCRWGISSDVKKDIQYFLDKPASKTISGRTIVGTYVHGVAEAADGCPVWTDKYWGRNTHGKIGDSVCQNKFSQPLAVGNWGAELFGDDSICLEQDTRFDVYQCYSMGISLLSAESAHGAGCYKYKCHRGRLMIQANYSLEGDPKYSFQRQYKICWGKGTVHIRRHQKSGDQGEWRFHRGVLICPDCKLVCENNSKYPGFKCAKDIRLNSTDYTGLECRQGVQSNRVDFYYTHYVATVVACLHFLSDC